MGASEVVGVCSAANAQLVRRQGATRCVDYNDQSAMDATVSEVGWGLMDERGVSPGKLLYE